jgi:uncharacterized protein
VADSFGSDALREQLAALRARMERQQLFAARPAEQQWPEDAREVTTEAGSHLELDRFFAFSDSHGSFLLRTLAEMLQRDQVFLDTETTGLAGGSGTLAFLTGLGWCEADGFRIRFYLLREHGDEASALVAIAAELQRFRQVVTYNGRAFDVPLLETRFTMQRQRTPFARMDHADLLYDARRVWKLRLESCRLVELEKQILGHERIGDVPGELIPHIWFQWLRTNALGQMPAVLHHNALDILSLACLAAIVPSIFADPAGAALRHGTEMVGVGRWLLREERYEEGVALMERAMRTNLSDELTFRTLRDLALAAKKAGQQEASLRYFSELATCANNFRMEALAALAIHYEHRERNFARALEMTEAALQLTPDADWHKRHARLQKKQRQLSLKAANERPST